MISLQYEQGQQRIFQNDHLDTCISNLQCSNEVGEHVNKSVV